MTKLIVPQWPMPRSVAACSLTRIGGMSLPPCDSLDLGTHCGDNLQHVEENRRRTFTAGGLLSYPIQLEQIHGTDILTLGNGPYPSKRVDTSYNYTPGTVCAVMTVDCLPVLFCSHDGTEVTAAYAGWRGLCEGVLEEAVAYFADKAGNMMAWLGPAIGPQAFEVGSEVRDASMAKDEDAHRAFRPADERYFVDVYQLVRQRLANVGVEQVFGGDRCTLGKKNDSFSYRHNKTIDRMASFIWLIQPRKSGRSRRRTYFSHSSDL